MNIKRKSIRTYVQPNHLKPPNLQQPGDKLLTYKLFACFSACKSTLFIIEHNCLHLICSFLGAGKYVSMASMQQSMICIFIWKNVIFIIHSCINRSRLKIIAKDFFKRCLTHGSKRCCRYSNFWSKCCWSEEQTEESCYVSSHEAHWMNSFINKLD